jgi:hypothetical protein
MAEHQLPKLNTGVRFPSSALANYQVPRYASAVSSVDLVHASFVPGHTDIGLPAPRRVAEAHMCWCARLAATALEHGLGLVTRNRKHFDPIRGVRIRELG